MLAAVIEDSLLLRCAVEHVEAALVDEHRHIVSPQIFIGKFQRLQGPTGYAYIEGLARPDDIDQCL